MIYSILVSSLVPLFFLYFVYRLNFFETHRPSLILLALAWGAVSGGLSYMVSHPMVPIFGRPFVSQVSAPIVEEIFKSLILLYLTRRTDHNFFVDGAIYGFAAGIGFAVEENMLYLSRVDENTGIVVSIARAFSASLFHGCSTALVGIIIGGFPMGRLKNPILLLLVGWTVAIAYHMAYNRVSWHFGARNFFPVVGMAFAGLSLVAAAIVWGLRRERQRLRRALAKQADVSKGEASLVLRIDDLDQLLAPVEHRFGQAKREQVETMLMLQAQLGLKQGLMRTTPDAELRAQLAPEVAAAKQEIKRYRSEIGVYAMSFVRSIVRVSAKSIWLRLRAKLAPRSRPNGADLWSTVGSRVRIPAPASPSLQDRITRVLASRPARAE